MEDSAIFETSTANESNDARVWQAFLSDQDRELALSQNESIYGIGNHPALLIIDVYQRVFGTQPQPILEAVTDNPNTCGLNAWEALPHIKRMLQRARKINLPVIHITGDPEIPGWRIPRGGKPMEKDEAILAYKFMEDVQPLHDEVVIVKSAPSAFFGTPLTALLKEWEIDSLIVAGQSTSGCVRASVVDARSSRVAVTVVEECVFDRTEASHAINLFDMNQKYADVREIDDVLKELENRFGAESNLH